MPNELSFKKTSTRLEAKLVKFVLHCERAKKCADIFFRHQQNLSDGKIIREKNVIFKIF